MAAVSGPFSILVRDIGRAIAEESGHALAAEAKKKGQRVAVAGAALWLGSFFFGIAGFSLALSAYLFLARERPDHQAMALVGGGAIVLTLLCGLGVWLALRPRELPETKEAKEAEQDVLALINLLEGEASEAIHKNAKNATVISLVAGLVLGLNPELRRSLFRRFSS
jgi:hypothetical protein